MSSSETGNTLNSYLLGPVLGIGTYGEVRFAIHKDTGKQVALKMVDLSRFRPDTATLMLREVNIVRKLDHPHVIKVLDVMRDEPFSGTFCSECACTVFRRNKQNPNICLSCAHENVTHRPQQQTKPMLVISQELAPGGELFSILMHGGALPEAVARHYFAQLLTAIDHCHSREVIHRDIKPENIVFDRQRLLKLVDFGLAACLDDKPENSIERNLSVLHSGVGSKPYSAPEVSYTREMYNATGYKGKPADIWSCAVVLFVMLTGRPPFYRPLLRSFNADLQKCKHFVRIIKGQGYEGVPPLARDLLMQLFKLNPDDRLSVEEIRKHPWMTQQLDGQFGSLPVSGVTPQADCDDVLAHNQYWIDLKIQTQVYNGNVADTQSTSSGNKQAFTLGDVEYFVDSDIPYQTKATDTADTVNRRQAYQHLCGWMLQRVRTAWDAMQRPDMVYALQTAFHQDEQLALQQAQNALVQQQQQAQFNGQQQFNGQVQVGAGGQVASRNFQQPTAVFGLPPSPVVLPNQNTGAPIPIQPLSISAAQNTQRPQHSLTQHSLTQHNTGGSNGSYGIPIGGEQHGNSQDGYNPMLVPLFPNGANNASQYPQSSLSQSGFLSQNPSQQQQQRDRDVAGTPLQQSLISSLATPGFSPNSPAVFGKMGQSIPHFGGQYILNNNGHLPQNYQSPQQYSLSQNNPMQNNQNQFLNNNQQYQQQQQQQQQQQHQQLMQQQQYQQQQQQQQQQMMQQQQYQQQYQQQQQHQQNNMGGGLSQQLMQHRQQQQGHQGQPR